MDLRTGQPVWHAVPPHPTRTQGLSHDEHCDVLVVGAGITGAMAAWHLTEAGLDVVVVDKRPIGQGSTAASTGLVLYELDVPLIELSERLGRSFAQAAFLLCRRALDDIERLVANAQVDCNLKRRPSLYLARHDDDTQFLQDEARARGEIGLEAKYLSRSALIRDYLMDRPGAVASDVGLEVDPLKLAVGLMNAAQKAGARVYGGVEIDPYADSISLRTTSGQTIHARDVVYALGYESAEQFPFLRKYGSINSTYALATEPLSPDRLWPKRAMLWEHADPYFYARTTPDDRIVIGGEDDEGNDADQRHKALDGKCDKLMATLNSLFDVGDAKVERKWAGAFATTDDGLPYIGAPRGCNDKIHFLLGYGGNGMTVSLLAAQIIRDRIQGRKNEAADIFSFNRNTAPKRRKEPICQ